MSSERKNRDLHLFTSNIIFSRIATCDMNNTPPQTDLSSLSADDILLCGKVQEKERLLYTYSILIARILIKIPAFKLYNKLIPDHIPHEHSEKMAMKSQVFPLPIQFKNESKHEDCLAIMDTYETQLSDLFTSAFGNVDVLRKFGVPVGGDQLTRVRLNEAKNLRTLSVSPEKRFDDLHPIVCEMWHSKQDFLEKCYKTLYKAENSPGTLHHFKTLLHRSSVNGKVKGRFQPHFELLMAVGEGLITEQLMEFLHMDTFDSKPDHKLLSDLTRSSPREQKDLLLELVHQFINHYGYGMADDPSKIPSVIQPDVRVVQKQRVMCLPNNQILLVPFQEFEVSPQEEDELYNYSMQLCHWFLHLSSLHDTAKEGDLSRVIANSKYSIPFFFSHSKLSKYMVENIDYVLKCDYLLSPLQRMRVIEGSFANLKGGRGNNIESDLVQENSVCNQKGLIKGLGANKSEASIIRVTGSADNYTDICNRLDSVIKVSKKSGRHTKAISEKDMETVYKELRRLRPFNVTPGRKCNGFSKVQPVPLTAEKVNDMKDRVNQIITRLLRGQAFVYEEESLSDNDIL